MFSEEVRKRAYIITNGFCEYEGCVNKATEFHHKLANTSLNRKLYPKFIDSIFNCMPICSDCHMTKPKVKISERRASIYESSL